MEVKLSPEAVPTITHDGSALHVEFPDGRSFDGASARKLFPLSHSSGFIALRDEVGTEITIMESLEALDAESRAVLDSELERRYFTPRISKIHFLKQEGGMWQFKVTTQRGDAEFFVRNWRDSAHEIGAGRWLVQSVDGQRFEIPGEGQLDIRSQALMEQVL